MRIRYRVFLISLAIGGVCLAISVFDYYVLFKPFWRPNAADRLIGFDAWYYYLRTGSGLLLVAGSVMGLWLATLIWLLPGRLIRKLVTVYNNRPSEEAS